MPFPFPRLSLPYHVMGHFAPALGHPQSCAFREAGGVGAMQTGKLNAGPAGHSACEFHRQK